MGQGPRGIPILPAAADRIHSSERLPALFQQSAPESPQIPVRRHPTARLVPRPSRQNRREPYAIFEEAAFVGRFFKPAPHPVDA